MSNRKQLLSLRSAYGRVGYDGGFKQMGLRQVRRALQFLDRNPDEAERAANLALHYLPYAEEVARDRAGVEFAR